MRPAPALALLALLAPLAAAQAPVSAAPPGVEFVVGGEPGITVAIDGADIRTGSTPGAALVVDPSRPVNLSLAMAPRPNVTWEISHMRAAILLRGPGSGGPAREQALDATIPPGYTVFVNRTLDLAPLKPVGSGVFLMRVDVVAKNGTLLYSEDVYVHVKGNVLLSVAGATATVATVATGYGLWSILNDLREVYKARERHRKKEAKASKLGKLAGAAIALEDGVEGAVDVAGDANADAERIARRRPLAWAATGLGLGAVGVSWAQFLGFVPIDVGQTLVAALGACAVFLTLAVLTTVLVKRAHARRAVSVPVQGAAEPSRAQAPVAPREQE